MLDSWLEEEPDAAWWLWIRNSIGILSTLGYARDEPAASWDARIGLLILIVVLSTAYLASFSLAVRVGMPVNRATGVLVSLAASLGIVCVIVAVTPLKFGLVEVGTALLILMAVRGTLQYGWRILYSIFSRISGS
jgi:hypothetical protein